ncbi:MAG: hypothetical protein ACO3FE_04790 [Planctomycetaceae bacterium]|jgi:hypothetical protein
MILAVQPLETMARNDAPIRFQVTAAAHAEACGLEFATIGNHLSLTASTTPLRSAQANGMLIGGLS